MDDSFIEIQHPIYCFLLRLCGDAELAGDLTQDTLARGLEKRGQLRESASLKPWLLRIAANCWKDYCRREARERNDANPAYDAVSLDTGPADAAMQRELGRRVWLAIAELPPRQQQVMHLRVVESMAVPEIAEILEIDTQLVRSNLAAARKSLRERFKDVLE